MGIHVLAKGKRGTEASSFTSKKKFRGEMGAHMRGERMTPKRLLLLLGKGKGNGCMVQGKEKGKGRGKPFKKRCRAERGSLGPPVKGGKLGLLKVLLSKKGFLIRDETPREG